MSGKAVIVERGLVNEYGSGYGTSVTVFAERREDAEKALVEKYGEERLYRSQGDVWEQFGIEIITAFDDAGNLNRHGGWLDLLKAFVEKEIGPSVLKAVARLMDEAGR